MSDAQRYRERAAFAERLAGDTADPTLRRQMLALAQDWRLLAARAEAADALAPHLRSEPIAQSGAEG